MNADEPQLHLEIGSNICLEPYGSPRFKPAVVISNAVRVEKQAVQWLRTKDQRGTHARRPARWRKGGMRLENRSIWPCHGVCSVWIFSGEGLDVFPRRRYSQ